MARFDRSSPGRIVLALAAIASCGAAVPSRAADEPTLAGAAAYGDYTKSAPGVTRHIRASDLPAPYATDSARNASKLVPRPTGAELHLPQGFAVAPLIAGFQGPRQMKLAPNGDIFLAESEGKRIRVIRAGADGQASASVFAQGIEYRPYGIAFYPPGPEPRFVYVATEGQVLRFPYHVGDLTASAKPDMIVPDVPVGHHWTRDIAFSPDGKRLMLAVGSGDNDGEEGMAKEERRADILDYDPDGHDMRIYASGIRNPVTIGFYPGTNDLWTTTNERDLLGDNLPPDYVTRVQPGGFYGWPWFYTGGNQDPRHKGERDELKDKVIVPDVLFQPHSAPLGLAFYTASQFPATYRGSAFVALHGSWNRAQRTGYKLVRIPVENGKPTGAYQDFMTGFVTQDGAVWGRPVGVVVTQDGSLLVSDDGSGTVWRISYTGEKRASQR
ncbi:MAG TPA: sorbosone dehydrogenase family protein [Stellaceae bacterium]|nr:sorbosone dehydrogenase family protein [Stellaceae bacterium]